VCETWSLTLREELRLRVFENRVMRIFGPKREEMAESRRRLHNEKLHNLYPSPNVIRVINSRMQWAGHVAHMGEMRNVYSILGGKSEWKVPLVRPRPRRKNDIRSLRVP
jgi:hypothetical protein